MQKQQFKKGHLGKGLSALIPKKSADSFAKEQEREARALHDDDTGDAVLSVSVLDIRANPYQPRTAFEENALEELVASIRVHGILQPLLVTRVDGAYELIAGERRLRAAKTVGLAKVPALVIGADEKQKLELALIENIQRENLNPIETARSYKALIETYSLTQDDLATRLGKSRSSVANLLRFLSLPAEIKDSLAKGEITEGHAKIIAGLASPQEQLNLWRKIAGQKLTVKDASKQARRIAVKGSARTPRSANAAAFEKALEHTLGTKVAIHTRGERGTVEIHFFLQEDLAQIVQKITGEVF